MPINPASTKLRVSLFVLLALVLSLPLIWFFIINPFYIPITVKSSHSNVQVTKRNNLLLERYLKIFYDKQIRLKSIKYLHLPGRRIETAGVERINLILTDQSTGEFPVYAELDEQDRPTGEIMESLDMSYDQTSKTLTIKAFISPLELSRAYQMGGQKKVESRISLAFLRAIYFATYENWPYKDPSGVDAFYINYTVYADEFYLKEKTFVKINYLDI